MASVDERIYFADLLARKSDTLEKGEIVLEQYRREAITAELEYYERDANVAGGVSKDFVAAAEHDTARWVGGTSFQKS